MLEQANDNAIFAADQCFALANSMHLHQLTHLGTVERHDLWRSDAVPTFEAWIAVRYGLPLEAARDEALLVRRLPDLPKIAEAYGEGLLSRQKLIAVCSFIEPEQDEHWAREAQGRTVTYIRRMARLMRRIGREEAAAIDGKRYLRITRDWMNDVVRIEGVIPGADGALVAKCFETLSAPRRGGDGQLVATEERQADALVAMAGLKLGESNDTARSTVVVHVDASELANDEGMAFVEDGPLVSSEVARRLACDGYVMAVAHGSDGQVVGIGRRSRVVPQALERAVRGRDQQCACCGTTFLVGSEIHHITPWGKGGPTNLDNLIVLCKRCHRLVHERNYRLIRHKDGHIELRKPDGVPVHNRPTPLRPDIRARMIGPPNRRVPARM